MEDVINASATACAQKNQEADGSSKTAATRIPYTTKQLLYHASQILKADLQDCNGIDTRPVNIDDLTLKSTKEIIPQSLYWILRWIISEKKMDLDEYGDIESRCSQHADERHILMICQDIVHAASHGRK